MLRNRFPIIFYFTIGFYFFLRSVSFTESIPGVYIRDDVEKITLGKHIQILQDKEGKYTIDDLVLKELSKKFLLSENEIPNFGFTSLVYWMRFKLVNSSRNIQQMLLEVGYPHIDDIQFYFFSDGLMIRSVHGGDLFPMQNNKMFYNHFITHVSILPESEIVVYGRFQTESSMQIPLILWKLPAFAEKVDKEKLILGLYFGIMLAMLFYNLFIFVFLKDRNYLYYVFYIGIFILTQMGVSRLDIMYLWPQFPLFANISHAVFFNLTFFFGGLFCRNFLNTKETAVYLDKAVLLMMWICIIGVALTFISGYTAGIKCVVYFGAVLGPVFMLSAGFSCWIKGNSIAKYYTLAWSVFLIAAIFFNLRNMGILPSIPIIDYSPHIGSSLEVFFLSIALSDRFNKMKNETILAKNRAFEAEKRFTAELREKVKERTEQLEKANIQLEKISNTDGLTGIFNRRYFNRQFSRIWNYHQRESRILSIIICDIDFFKQFNDTYGHLSGDECLKTVAAAISRIVSRPYDFTARYGGEEFVIVLPGIDSKGALSVAQKIRKEINGLRIEHSGSCVNPFLTLSFGIASMIPTNETNPTLLISNADNALYQSKKEGRNRISLKSIE